MKRLQILLLVLTAMLAGCSQTAAEHPPVSPRIEVGVPFPDLLLPDLDGRPASVAQWRGRKVILHIFASW
jgi:cytochrome oxidase Cu insertion factor (SCO1/SenC/PrrC family)